MQTLSFMLFLPCNPQHQGRLWGAWSSAAHMHRSLLLLTGLSTYLTPNPIRTHRQSIPPPEGLQGHACARHAYAGGLWKQCGGTAAQWEWSGGSRRCSSLEAQGQSGHGVGVSGTRMPLEPHSMSVLLGVGEPKGTTPRTSCCWGYWDFCLNKEWSVGSKMRHFKAAWTTSSFCACQCTLSKLFVPINILRVQWWCWNGSLSSLCWQPRWCFPEFTELSEGECCGEVQFLVEKREGEAQHCVPRALIPPSPTPYKFNHTICNHS